jgi:Predicted transcriptional regulator with C-terminal CBS domains
METVKFDDYLNDRLQDNGFKEGYVREHGKLASAVSLVTVRESAGLTQRELADLAHVPQSTIARIERGDNTSFDTLSKIAFAMGSELKVEFW